MSSSRNAAAVRPLRAGVLEAVPWLRHGFSTRKGGTSSVYGTRSDLNVGLDRLDEVDDVRENRRRLVEATIGPGSSWPVVTARQTHSAVTLTVREAIEQGEGDALVSSTASLLLGILTADCVPVLLADTRLRVVAAVHAGWRGTAARIVEQTVGAMREEFGTMPGDLLAAVGPSIGPCCYEVGEEVRQAFAEEFFQGDRLDLWRANRWQLLAAGLEEDAIEMLGECTACTRDEDGTRRFFSHRAEHGRTGRMMAVIGVTAKGDAGMG